MLTLRFPLSQFPGVTKHETLDAFLVNLVRPCQGWHIGGCKEVSIDQLVREIRGGSTARHAEVNRDYFGLHDTMLQGEATVNGPLPELLA
jgi:hypothetical protein